MSAGKLHSETLNAGRNPLRPSLLGSTQESSAPKSSGAGDFRAWTRVIHGADAPWLDSCDEHRNEGGRGSRRAASKAWHA